MGLPIYPSGYLPREPPSLAAILLSSGAIRVAYAPDERHCDRGVRPFLFVVRNQQLEVLVDSEQGFLLSHLA
jgi:hypothetical protein